MPPNALHLAHTCWWWMWASGVLFCWELLLGMQFVGYIYFSSQLGCPPSFKNFPQMHPVRGFPGVWTLPLLELPSWDRSPSLTLLFLFLSFIFCPTSFRRQRVVFLGAWCPLLAIRSCFLEFAQCSNDLSMNLWGRKWSPCSIPPPS